MGIFYAISVPEDGPYRFDFAGFRVRLQRRRPDACLDLADVTQLYTFSLPPHPLGVILDPTSPGGLRWWPRLMSGPDTDDAGRRWQLVSTVPNYMERHTLSSDHRGVWVEGSILDCVVIALWLRDWPPPTMPLSASIGGDTHTAVVPGITIVGLARQMLLDQAEDGRRAYQLLVKVAKRSPDGWWRTEDGGIYLDPRPWFEREAEDPPVPPEWSKAAPIPPEDQPSEEEIYNLLNHLLGDEARQFFPTHVAREG